MKYLIKFSKQGYIKYISHLDMIRLFKRAFKKSGMPLHHSQGFNPHPKMTFGQPLSLGYTSVGELLEIDTKDDFEPSEVISKLQAVMPDGITIMECEVLTDKTKGVAGRIKEAQYEIVIDDMGRMSTAMIDSFFAQDEIICLKKQKKKKEMKEVNIKPMIRKVEHKIVDGKLVMLTNIDCGSSSNLNPDLLVQAFSNYIKMDIPSENVEIQRNYLK